MVASSVEGWRPFLLKNLLGLLFIPGQLPFLHERPLSLWRYNPVQNLWDTCQWKSKASMCCTDIMKHFPPPFMYECWLFEVSQKSHQQVAQFENLAPCACKSTEWSQQDLHRIAKFRRQWIISPETLNSALNANPEAKLGPKGPQYLISNFLNTLIYGQTNCCIFLTICRHFQKIELGIQQRLGHEMIDTASHPLPYQTFGTLQDNHKIFLWPAVSPGYVLHLILKVCTSNVLAHCKFAMKNDLPVWLFQSWTCHNTSFTSIAPPLIGMQKVFVSICWLIHYNNWMGNSHVSRALKGGLCMSPVWISKLGMSLFRKVPVSLSEFQHDITTSMLTEFGRKLYLALTRHGLWSTFLSGGALADWLWAFLS